MGGSAIDGLIFADLRATNPLVVQISLPFRPVPSRLFRRPGGGEISCWPSGHAQESGGPVGRRL